MKTKEELLKIYSSYLPYELKFISYMDVPFDEMAINPIWTLDGINKMFGDYCLLTKENSDAYSSATCKPLLFSLDYLTKEIDHKGERFVAGLMLVDPDREEWDKMICETYKPFSQLPIEYIRVMHESLGEIISINPKNVGHLPYNIFTKLLEMHFNVFGLSDSEYIKKETLNQ